MKGAEEFKPPKQNKIPIPKKLDSINGAELMLKDLPKKEDIIDGIIPIGLSILAGAPKKGKSWMALGMALAVASDSYALGKIKVKRGEAFYLGLEDSERRLQNRLKKLGDDIPATLHTATRMFPTHEGGLEQLRAWLKEHPECRLLIIDTAARIRPPQSKNPNIYAEDIAFGSQIQELAFEFDIAIVLVSHVRKALADDPLETVQGSMGYTGVADAVLVLQRERRSKEGVLHITGRDIEERALTLQFRPKEGTWVVLGELEEAEFEELSEAEKSDLDEATSWLSSQLKNGAMLASRLISTAKKEGIKERTLKRAKQKLNALSRRESIGNKGEGAWLWFFSECPHIAESEKVGILAKENDENADRDSIPTTMPE